MPVLHEPEDIDIDPLMVGVPMGIDIVGIVPEGMADFLPQSPDPIPMIPVMAPT